MWVGDSQSEQNSNRLGGQIAVNVDAPITGLLAYFASQDSVGIYNEVKAITGPPSTTSAKYEPGDNWPGSASNSGLHGGYSRNILVTGGNLGNNVSVHRVGLTNASNFTGDLDLNTEWSVNLGYINDSASWVGVGLREFRDATAGNTINLGASDGSGDADGNFDGAGGIDVVKAGTLEGSIRSAASFGSADAEPVGIDFITRGTSGDEEDLNLQLVFAYFKEAAVGSYPTHGLNFACMFQGGYSADDHIDNIANATRTAEAVAMNGIDTVYIMLGHNPENSGDRAGNIETLANNYITRCTGAGYSAPDIVLIAPWASDGAASYTEADVDAIFQKCVDNGWGFINLWDRYNGVDPGTYDSGTYTMDGSDLHPGNAATADQIAEDILYEMNNRNTILELSVASQSRDRSRARGR